MLPMQFLVSKTSKYISAIKKLSLLFWFFFHRRCFHCYSIFWGGQILFPNGINPKSNVLQCLWMQFTLLTEEMLHLYCMHVILHTSARTDVLETIMKLLGTRAGLLFGQKEPSPFHTFIFVQKSNSFVSNQPAFSPKYAMSIW